MKTITLPFPAILLAVPVAIIASCGPGPRTTVLASFTDPAFASGAYRHVIVYVPTTDLHWRQRLENNLVGELGRRGVRAVPSLQILPPTRHWSDSARAAAFRYHGASGLIVLTQLERWSVERRTPTTAITTVAHVIESGARATSAIVRASSAIDEDSTKSTRETTTEQSTTTVQEGTLTLWPWVRYEIRLVDLATGATAWIGVDDLPRDYAGAEAFAARFATSLALDGMLIEGR